ncbi:MAG: helix-turn-helix transcriptional regulator [Solirubrobacterales bacterium]|nr:helix-turn-helix transcriptional regulator [Solirubrobacterales bacterium]
MPLQHAVLALLTQGPSYGYQLKAQFEDAIGPQWGELNIGHLYQILDRLVRDELVVGETVDQVDRPAKTVYELSDAGREELCTWMGRPYIRQSGYRDDFFLKLFAASLLGVDELRQVANRQRVAHLAEIRALSDLRPPRDALVELLIDAALLDTRARLELAEKALERAPLLVRVNTRSAARTPSQSLRRKA